MNPRLRRLASMGGVTLWLTFLFLTIGWAHRLDLGRGHPPLDPAGLYRWAARTPPELITMELVRLLVLLTATVQALSTLVGLVASVVHPGRLSSTLLRLVPALVRTGIETAAGLGLTGALMMGQLQTAGADPRPPATVVMERLDTPPDTGDIGAGPGAVQLATMKVITDPPVSLPDRDQIRLLRLGSGSDGRALPATSDVWTVRPGDNLWDIAETTLAARSPDPTPAEVWRYWRRVIEANRSRLVDPGDPGLILPGQSIVLPPS